MSNDNNSTVINTDLQFFSFMSLKRWVKKIRVQISQIF